MYYDVPRPGGTALNTLIPIENMIQLTEVNYYTPKPNPKFHSTKGSNFFQHKTLDARTSPSYLNTRSNSTKQAFGLGKKTINN